MSCCSEVVDIGCVDFCSTISLGYNATQTGTHTLEIRIRGNNWQTHEVSYTLGGAMTIPSGILKESGENDIKIKQPDGTYYEFDTTDGIECARVVTGIYSEIIT